MAQHIHIPYQSRSPATVLIAGILLCVIGVIVLYFAFLSTSLIIMGILCLAVGILGIIGAVYLKRKKGLGWWQHNKFE